MTDLRCAECGRTYDAPSCGIVHAITGLQIEALRRMSAAIYAAAERARRNPR